MLLQLSFRNLFRHKRRNALLLIAIIGAVAGVSASNTLIRGIQIGTAEGAVENLVGHVKVHAPGYRDDPRITNSFSLSADYVPPVASDRVVGWSARINVPAVIMSERETRGIALVGIDPATENISFLADAVIEGDRLSGPDDRRVLVGKELARQLETQVGKRLVLISQGADDFNRERGFRIAGVYDAEGIGLEKTYVFVGLNVLKQVLESQNITEFSIRLASERDREAAKAAVAGDLDELEVKDWQELEPQAAALYLFADGIIYIWFFLMMSALTFGLVNTLAAAVMERSKELGMLRALGMRKRTVVLQVVLESSVLMLIGVVLGLVLGWLLYLPISDGIDLRNYAEGMESFSVPAILQPVMLTDDLITVGGMSLVLGILASIYPAWRVTKIKPLDALRQ